MTILDIRSSRQFSPNDVAWILTVLVGILLSMLTLFGFNMSGYGIEQLLGLNTNLGAYEEVGVLLGFWIVVIRLVVLLLFRR